MTTSALDVRALRVDPEDIVGLWAEARVFYLAQTFPRYGSPAWWVLPPDDPRRYASVIHAAEMWRRYGDEAGLIQWFHEASVSREAIHRRRTLAELDEEARRSRERAAEMWARKRATTPPNPRWPKVAVPGQENRR